MSFVVAFFTKGLNIKPITSLVAKMMMILGCGFPTIKARKFICTNHSTFSYCIIYGITCLSFFICQPIFRLTGFSSTIKTIRCKTIVSAIVNPKPVICFPTITLPTKFFFVVNLIYIFLIRYAGPFSGYFKNTNIATHRMNKFCTLKINKKIWQTK